MYVQQVVEVVVVFVDVIGKVLEVLLVGNCDVIQVQSLVGQLFIDVVGSQVQQDVGVKQLCVFKFSDLSMMEFMGECLNIELDEKGVISGLCCG